MDRAAIARVYAAIHHRHRREDAWHEHSSRVIRRFLHAAIHRGRRTVDLGAGRIDYGIDAIRLDFVIEAVRDQRPSLVGDVARLPLRTASVDVVCCVGSVINYVPLFEALGEIARVLRSNGVLILEYERLCECGLVRPALVTYQGVKHVLWAYSDEYVDAALAENGFAACSRSFFHILSSAARPILGRAAAVLGRTDPYLARYGFAARLAANAILQTQRVAA